MSEPIEQLTAADMAERIARRQLTAVALVKACLARIEARESVVGAWAYLDPEHALEQARRRDASTPVGPLHGIPVGLKDIIETKDMPTAYGSRIYEGSQPTQNAACVDRLIEQGAIILGKTVTTEFANRFPGKTANPHNPEHTPGGSSSGSAAAVADFMVPMALGTQTTGSILRPASFCGVFGYKPTFGLFDISGVLPLAPSMDTLGLICRSANDLEFFAAALTCRPRRPLNRFDRTPPKVGICRTPAWPHAEEATRLALEHVSIVLSKLGVPIRVDWEMSNTLDGLLEAQRIILAYETARSLAREYRDHREHLSKSLYTLLDYGFGLADEVYENALSRAKAARAAIKDAFGDHDVLLTPSSRGEAPLGLESTGEPVFNAIWTLLRLPCVTVPLMTGPHGLPVGIQVVGRPGDDVTVLSATAWLSKQLR